MPGAVSEQRDKEIYVNQKCLAQFLRKQKGWFLQTRYNIC